MKHSFILLFLFLSAGIYSCSLHANEPEIKPIVSKVPFGDPFIMLWEGKYYAYGTLSPDGIAVFVSDDLLTWTTPEGATNGLALNKADVWADRWFWAPERGERKILHVLFG